MAYAHAMTRQKISVFIIVISRKMQKKKRDEIRKTIVLLTVPPLSV